MNQSLLVNVYVDHMYVEGSQLCFQVHCVEVDNSKSGTTKRVEPQQALSQGSGTVG